MRIFIIITAITLLAVSGCNKKDDEGPNTLPEGSLPGNLEEIAEQELGSPETSTDNSAVQATLDAVFKEYEYPASKLEDTVTVANTVSAIYKTSDDYVKVVAYYLAKFPDAPPQPGTSAYFGVTYDDGSSLTVTVTKFDNETTQIIVKKSERM